MMLAAFLILWLYLFSARPAEAAFLIPVVASALAVSTFAATVIVTVGSLALSFGLSYVANKLLSKPTDPGTDVGGAQLSLKAAADVPYSLIFGRAVTAGSLAYVNTGGQGVGGTLNANLIQIIALADHPCHRLAGMFVAGLPAALTDLTTEEGASVEGWAGTIGLLTKDEYFTKFGMPAFGSGGRNAAATDGISNPGNLVTYEGKLRARFYDGTQTAVDALANSITYANGQVWPSTAIGHGATYARLHLVYDGEKVTGPLEWKFVVDGLSLYDPRKDSSVGGSGAHRWSNQSTYEWTDNVAVMVYNIVRGIYFGTEFIYGIEGTTADQLPLDIWFAAMNECDVAVALAVGSEKQFTAGGEISVKTAPLDAITALLKACGGRFVEIGGIYKLYIGAPGVPVLTFSDDDIRANESDTFQMVLPLEQRVNYVTGKYVLPDDGWIEKIAPARSDPAFIAEDGRRLPADLDASMVQSNTQMQRLQTQLLQRARRERKHVIPLPPVGMVLEPGDVFAWNSARNGYANKLFEIDGIDYDGNLNVLVSCTEVDHADYDWSAGLALPSPSGQIITKYPDAKVVPGFFAEPFTYLGDDGTAAPAIRLLWDNPNDPDATSILWQLRVAADPTNFTSGSSDDVPAQALIIVGGLQPITTYQVRAKFGSSAGYASDWSLWISVTTGDIRISVADFEANVTKRVTDEFQAASDAMQNIADFIAATVAEQDANNWLDKAAEKGNNVVTRTLVEDNKTAVTTLAAAVETNEGAFATYQTDVSAQFVETNANVSTNATAITTNSDALASYQITTNASIGGLNTSVTTNQTAITTINGKLAAQWTVVLDANGYVSSLKGYNDGSTSGWIFIGNVFQVAFPGSGGGAPVQVFTISNVNGSPKIVIRADIIADGIITAQKMVTATITAASGIIADAAIGNAQIQNASITTLKVQDLNVTTVKIAGNAVTSPAVAVNNTPVGIGTSYVNLLSVSSVVTLEPGYTYWAEVNGFYDFTRTAPAFISGLLAVNGTQVQTVGVDTQVPAVFLFALPQTGNGSPQTVTADLYAAANTAGIFTINHSYLSIKVSKR